MKLEEINKLCNLSVSTKQEIARQAFGNILKYISPKEGKEFAIKFAAFILISVLKEDCHEHNKESLDLLKIVLCSEDSSDDEILAFADAFSELDLMDAVIAYINDNIDIREDCINLCGVAAAMDGYISEYEFAVIYNLVYDKDPMFEQKVDLRVSEDAKGNRYVYFGHYPTQHVNDESLIACLRKLNPNKEGLYEWNGDFYVKKIAQLDNDGADFDGNIIEYYYSDGERVVSNKEEWFLCKKVTWYVVDENSDSYLLLSKNVLDVKSFYGDSDSFYDENNVRTIDGTIINKNNYVYSDIRKVLNETLINVMFNNDEKALIVDSEIEEQGFKCRDKLFLLNREEAEKYVDSSLMVACGTDYSLASCQALGNIQKDGVDSTWYLRNGRDGNNSNVELVTVLGNVWFVAPYFACGVRLAVRIKK